MADNNKLYRIEVLAHDNLPEIDTMGMLLTNEGISYVKLHPVRIKATQKAEESEKGEPKTNDQKGSVADIGDPESGLPFQL